MSRAKFLLSVSLVALLYTLGPQTVRADILKDKNGKPINMGLQLYSVRDDCAKDLPGVLKAVAKMGYTGVEFAGYHGRTAQELRQLLDENHLKCYGTHIALDTLMGDNLEKTIEFNKVLGNKFLCVPWIPTERRNSKAAL